MSIHAPLRNALGVCFLALFLATEAFAGGGPFGIDHAVDKGDDRGLWARRNQLILQDGTALFVIGSALWEGSESRFGQTAWKATDSILLGAATAQVMKLAFSRARPAQGEDPNLWFQGSGHRSFPSGEVMEITTAVTPFILEYGAENPAVYGLALLPVYDAIARVRSRGHWQSDVLASLAIGSAIGYYAHSRQNALTLGVIPGGVWVGWSKRF
ncbi:MAG: phosphatase PAP2 family protein [Caldimonas sp.]